MFCVEYGRSNHPREGVRSDHNSVIHQSPESLMAVSQGGSGARLGRSLQTSENDQGRHGNASMIATPDGVTEWTAASGRSSASGVRLLKLKHVTTNESDGF